jgi:serine phosphatase RsbU (regulator of sigma subunit)
MSARQDMAMLLGQWLEFTLAESSAIAAAAWSRVHEIQASKAELQRTMIDTQERWAKENPHGENSPSAYPFRAEVARLISLESRNAELVAAQQRRARARQEIMEQVQRNLRKIRGSYVNLPPTPVLQCYS